jgi:hypothetical protein
MQTSRTGRARAIACGAVAPPRSPRRSTKCRGFLSRGCIRNVSVPVETEAMDTPIGTRTLRLAGTRTARGEVRIDRLTHAAPRVVRGSGHALERASPHAALSCRTGRPWARGLYPTGSARSQGFLVLDLVVIPLRARRRPGVRPSRCAALGRPTERAGCFQIRCAQSHDSLRTSPRGLLAARRPFGYPETAVAVRSVSEATLRASPR